MNGLFNRLRNIIMKSLVDDWFPASSVAHYIRVNVSQISVEFIPRNRLITARNTS